MSQTTVDIPSEKSHEVSASAETGGAHVAKKRSVGQKLVDFFIYPVFNNSTVFALSTWSTYMSSNHGPDTIKLPIFGEKVNFLKVRSTDLKCTLAGVGHGLSFAEKKLAFKGVPTFKREVINGGITVFWSFFDGSMIAPFVALLEHKRTPMADAIDHTLGTKPAERETEEEPKLSLKSLLKGRAATAAVVVPVALALSQGPKTLEMVNGKAEEVHHSLNYHVFEKPGARIGGWIERSFPSLTRRFPNVNFKGLGEIALFELFYTSVCTGGLYVLSRVFAKKSRDHAVDAPPSPHESAPIAEPGIAVASALAEPARRIDTGGIEHTPSSSAASHHTGADNAGKIAARRAEREMAELSPA